MRRTRKVTIKKAGIQLKCVAYEPRLSLEPPEYIKNYLRKPLKYMAGFFIGKTLFNKSVHEVALYDLLRYFHYQSVIGYQVLIGTMMRQVRRALSLDILPKISEKTLDDKIKVVKYFLFPYVLHTIVYEDHLPYPFLAYQVDRKTVATSYRDADFAKKVFSKLPFSGYRVLAWTSNYFLGYPKKFELVQGIDPSKRDVLITTCASVPGFNIGLKEDMYYSEALNRNYAEEEFANNKNAINFSSDPQSEITKPVVIINDGSKYKLLTVDQKKSLKMMKQKNVVSIIYPIALLTRENYNSKDWLLTPQKNVSGFLLGYKDNKIVTVAFSSRSYIRIKVNDLMPYIDRICARENINFFCYVHTDDGGAVGEFANARGKLYKYSPIWGHCFSSLVGFVNTRSVIKMDKLINHVSRLSS